jgi:hypothetical protein
MARLRTCDVCGKPAEIVAKIYLSPVRNGKMTDACNYSVRADIGRCCVESVNRFAAWTKRRKKNVDN